VGGESPFITVVVPTKDNESTIAELMESLARQSYRSFEVVVVDSSRDRTPEIASRYSFARVVKVPPVGLNVARNTGVREARGEVVAFTDGDCRASHDWLQRVAEFFTSHPDAAAVGGSVLTAREEAGKIVADYYNEALWPMMPVYRDVVEISACNFHRVRVPNGNNLAFRREVLLRNPFDEGLKGGYDEVELLWRLCASGFKVYAAPEIRVEHFHTSSLRRMLKRGFSYGRGHYLFYRKHPRAPLARYGLWGALALWCYYALLPPLALFGLWQPLALLPAAYAALAAAYLAKGKRTRSPAYPLLDILFYSAMAAGALYEAARAALSRISARHPGYPAFTRGYCSSR
jgi:glycosyltransferase involved in cell wall biosynthesis